MEPSRVIHRTKLLRFSAVLSILVVLIHTENLGIYGIAPNTSRLSSFVWYLERFLSGNLAKVGVPAFFMLSGVLFYRDFSFSVYKQKMKNRVFSLLIPYLLWNLFRFCLFYALGQVPWIARTMQGAPVSFTPMQLLEAVFFYRYNLGYWFMYQLILYTLLCPFIFTLLRKKWIAVLSLSALFVLFSTDALGNLSVGLFQKRFLQIDGLFYYMLGGAFAIHAFDYVNRQTVTTRRLGLLGMVLGQVCFVLFQKTNFLALYLLFCAVSAVSFWYVFDYAKDKQLPACMTSITFFIYSAHGTVLELFQAINQRLFSANAVTALLEYLLLPCVTLGILAAAAYLFKRFTPRLWRLVNGGR